MLMIKLCGVAVGWEDDEKMGRAIVELSFIHDTSVIL